jgi:hypothetical protein
MRQTDIWTDRQTDRQMDRQTDKRTVPASHCSCNTTISVSVPRSSRSPILSINDSVEFCGDDDDDDDDDGDGDGDGDGDDGE